jgi:hypothetical protein
MRAEFAQGAYNFYAALPAPAREIAKRTYGLVRPPGHLPELMKFINRGDALNTRYIRRTAENVESWLASGDPNIDRIGVHRDVGMALYRRSPDLHGGVKLPPSLRRFSYPAFLSVALNTHCNAACFFCREADYKGELVNFDDLPRLDEGVRNARVLEFTGWGEPFFYPRLAEVIERWIALNATP